MMKKNVLLWFLSCLLLIMSSGVNAETTASVLKIGYVDLSDVVQKLNLAKAYQDELKKEDDKIAEEENKARANIEKDVAAMEKLDEKAKRAKQAALSATINKLQQEFNEKRTALEKKRVERQNEIEKQLQVLLDQIRKDKGYYMLLNKAAVLALSDEARKFDETPNLVQMHNKTFKIKPKTENKSKTGK